MGYTNKFTSMIFSLRYLATLPTTQRTLLILSDLKFAKTVRFLSDLNRLRW